jgi:hypothetical protein
MKFVKNRLYTRQKLRIKNGDTRTDQIIEGELCSFFGRKMKNKPDIDGFIYEVRNSYNLIKRGTTNLHRHIFYKELKPTAEYKYLGESTHEKRYSRKQNKAFW